MAELDQKTGLGPAASQGKPTKDSTPTAQAHVAAPAESGRTGSKPPRKEQQRPQEAGEDGGARVANQERTGCTATPLYAHSPPLAKILLFVAAPLLFLLLLGFFLSPCRRSDLQQHHQAEEVVCSPASCLPSQENIPAPFTMASTEQTFIAIKPDGVQRGLVGPIISRFENRGFKLAAIKLVTPGKEHLENHYADLAGKPFFAGLIEYMNSGPICAMVWEGRDAVKTGRTILGATNPLASAPGTIRGDFAIDVGRNVCHGSDSVENAKKEIALWFKEGDLVSYKSAQFDWIYEKP
ncbi:Nucleoside diphosphate kinase [Zalerion maritima]|uniref:Nucleoside diphosphate kinase n=1 Tax=Zalerion maritima TaxID=339359 RepID=A0AAD5RG39_9PEZI|nr:Nucleoside diphosphate kinase [Zalerion maritima]